MALHLFAAAAASVLTMLQPTSQPEISDPLPPPKPVPEVRVVDYRTEKDGREYAWSVMIPPGAEEGGPGLLFLHGYGECGDDGKKQLTVGLPPAVRKNPERWPMVIIVPQKPVHNSEWEDHEAAVLAIVAEAAEKGHYDPGRLAITGLSQGGHGTIAFASRHPDRFRAAAPVCGYVDRRFDDRQQRVADDGARPEDAAVRDAAERLAGMPVWLFHGAKDPVVPASESRSLDAALRSRDAEVKYTEYSDADHNSWDAAYAEPELAAWLVRHTR
jgi:predicted peptidase